MYNEIKSISLLSAACHICDNITINNNLNLNTPKLQMKS